MSKKQASISSFFTRPSPSSSSTATAPSASRSSQVSPVSPVATKNGKPRVSSLGGETGSKRSRIGATKTAEKSVEELGLNVEGLNGAEEAEEDEEPAQKRVRRSTSRVQSSSHDRDVDDTNFLSPIDPNGSTKHTTSDAGNAKPTRTIDAAAKGRTDKFRFSQDVPSSNGAEASEQLDGAASKEKEALHRKFVRRLGGADNAFAGRRRLDTHDPAETAGDEDGDEEEETPAPTTSRAKGKKAPGPRKLTPMEKQVLEIKRDHKDTLLIVEVGYKFQFFGEDARTAAKELSIVCIPGKMRFDEHPSEAHLDRFAGASIPTHRLHVHVKRLVEAGHKVGVVRQLETAALKAAGDNRNAPFVRKLTNLYTKGTYIDEVEAPQMAASPATGYLLCLTETNAKGWGNDEKVQVGIIAVQPATGDIIYDEFEDGFMRSEIETRLLHIAPCEFLIVGELSKATEKLVSHLSGSKANVFGDAVRVERVEKSKTVVAQAYPHVSTFYADRMSATGDEKDSQASDLLNKVLKLSDHVTICLSAMITHLKEYGLEHVFDLTKYFQPFSARSHMHINGNTLTSLEIYRNQTDHSEKGSLFWALNRTKTKFGQRLLRKWVGRPLLQKEVLEQRVAAVEDLLGSGNANVERLKGLLARVRSDLEKSLIRIYYGKCSRPELLTVLQTMQLIANEFAHVKSPSDAGFGSSLINEAIASLPTILEDVVGYLDKINMDAARKDDKYEFFREEEETEEITLRKLGIASVEHDLDCHRAVAAQKIGKKMVAYVTVAGIDHLIEVENSSPSIKKVPASWTKQSGTKKVSRFHTPEVTKLIRERDQHKEALAAACDAAFANLLRDISSKYQTFRDCLQSLATLDCLLSLVTVASQPGYIKPSFTTDITIEVKGGRHPMVEQILLDSYIPNDISLSTDSTRALLVTGPNMGGKSSYVRSVALISIMAQIGSYVPATSARIGLLDAVYTRMGAFDNMMAGESTFMVELSETSDILKCATKRSLVILDELGRGTSTHDGVAIASAVLEFVVREKECLCLFITHYQAMAAMTDSFAKKELRNVHMKFTADGDDADHNAENITFLYEVGPGVAHRSYGLNVARLANVPEQVIAVAKGKSTELEKVMERRRVGGVVRALGRLEHGSDDEKVDLEALARAIEML